MCCIQLQILSLHKQKMDLDAFKKIRIILVMPRIFTFEIVSLAIIPNITFPWFERFHVSKDVPERHASQGGQELRTK